MSRPTCPSSGRPSPTSGRDMWTKEDDQITIIGILLIVLVFILVRSCDSTQGLAKPPTPPESFYTPGG